MINFTDHTEEELLQLYQFHKDLYYGKIEDTEEESISDSEFDELEQYLIDTYGFEPFVGAEEDYGRHVKASHIFPMLSLDKHHAKEELSYEEAIQLMSIINKTSRSGILSFKEDGFGINSIYVNGKLDKIITRGNKLQGADITAKFRSIVPQTIEFNGTIEVRSEAMISKSVFEKKYSKQYAHPRNIVVGIKNNIDLNDERINDVSVIAVDAVSDKIAIPICDISLVLDSSIVEHRVIHSAIDLMEAYKQMLNQRHLHEFPTDGLVLSPNTQHIRKHNGHHPLNSIAIKFPAPLFETTVTSIKPNQKRTGNIIPRIWFEPVIVDGRKIEKCSGYNYAFIVKNKINTGAKIQISLQGDIIPAFKKLIIESDQELQLPGDSWDGVNRVDSTVNLEWYKFSHALHQLGFDGFGGSAFKVLYNVLNTNSKSVQFYDIFNSVYINEESIREIGPNKARKLIQQIRAIKEIPLRKVITMMGIDGCGGTTAKQIARKLSGLEYDYSGLEKSVVESFESDSENYIEVNTVISLLNFCEVKVTYEIDTAKPSADSIFYVLTGSPKVAGFKTKEVFKQQLPSDWVETGDMKIAKYLITDDLSSNSSKMGNAKKLGINIITYSEAINLSKQ